MKYFSMFTGVGGFELGIKQANPTAECVGFSEINKYANQVLRKQFKKVKNYGDATKINARELPDFDLLCAGFPCQSFSIAGKRKGFKDTRGTMFFEIARILKIKRPKLVLLENVKGLLNHAKGQTFRVIIQSLEELGYDTQWMVFNSKFFGVPQNRERVFIIGSLKGQSRPEVLPFRTSNENINEGHSEKAQTCNTITATYWKGGKGTHLQQIIPGGQGNRVYNTEGISTTIASQAGGRGAKTGLYAVLTPNRLKKRQNGRRFKEDGVRTSKTISPCIRTPKGGGHLPMIKITGGLQEHASTICDCSTALTEAMGKGGGHTPIVNAIRRLTPIECERLQGFPDDWTKYGVNENGEEVLMSDTQRYKMMGNAVTVNVVAALMQNLLGCFGHL